MPQSSVTMGSENPCYSKPWQGGAHRIKGRCTGAGVLRLSPQTIAGAEAAGSLGEIRRNALSEAFASRADVMLLDEPSQDLDASALSWLMDSMAQANGALLVVSHDEKILAHFEHFFLLSESGGRYLPGRYSEVAFALHKEQEDEKMRYVRTLTFLRKSEERNAILARRRRRKKMGGRVRELDRAPSKALLNSKRSYAQESQGKRFKLQNQRIEAERALAKASRRELAISLPMCSVVPELPVDLLPAIELDSVCFALASGKKIGPLCVKLRENRLALTGANGSGKTTVLQVMLGKGPTVEGKVRLRESRIGYIAQGSENWSVKESLIEALMGRGGSRQFAEAVAIVETNGFPLALAQRPLRSLSAGERFRAALLFQLQCPTVNVLMLDEPTSNLDGRGIELLRDLLNQWQGGLVIASHNQEFLRQLAITEEIAL